MNENKKHINEYDRFFGERMGKSLVLRPDELYGLLDGIASSAKLEGQKAILKWVEDNFQCLGMDTTTGEHELDWN